MPTSTLVKISMIKGRVYYSDRRAHQKIQSYTPIEETLRGRMLGMLSSARHKASNSGSQQPISQQSDQLQLQEGYSL